MRTYKDVKWFLNYGKDVADLFGSIQPIGDVVDYYHPSNANWSYQFQICKFDDKLYEVMTQFGSVVGGREIRLPDNKDKAGL